jgi:hypothetical protein
MTLEECAFQIEGNIFFREFSLHETSSRISQKSRNHPELLPIHVQPK